jgi:tRNA A-37 threonylcarbamoyl transferase component Bud32
LLTYISAKHAQALKECGLHTFDQVWKHPMAWFEAPNECRGGWSGVARLQLELPNGSSLCLFVKKQQNHGRLTLLHPINGEPTFRREYKRLQYLESRGIAAPQVVFYAEQVVENKTCAILVTEELSGYQSLESLAEPLFVKKNLTRVEKQQLFKVVASTLRNFHRLGLVHRALYPKHIFVKDAGIQPQVALIDLEKARFTPFFWYRAYYDLAALNRHAEFWGRTDRLYLFMQYCQIRRLGKLSKWLCRQLIKRSKRK